MAHHGVTLDEMDYLSAGKRTRLYRMLYEYGPGHGRMMILPIDQGLEHGPRDFFENPDSADPEFQYRLAVEGRFSAIALQVGLAEKFYGQYAGRVPLVVKVNGKTEIPPDDAAFSPLTGTVGDAVRLGADAIGYTIYVGSASQDRDFTQFNQVRVDAERYGIPVIVWAYPRGSHVKAKGGQDTLWAVDYAARVAQELGADVVKVNFPKGSSDTQSLNPKPYDTLKLPPEEAMRQVVRSAGRTLVLVSGGAKKGDDDLLKTVDLSLKAGVTGFIFGRNLWQRKYPEALKMAGAITEQILNTVGAKEAKPKPKAAARA